MRKMMEEYGFMIFIAVVAVVLIVMVTPIRARIINAINSAFGISSQQTQNEIIHLNKKHTFASLVEVRGDSITPPTFVLTVTTASSTDKYRIEYRVQKMSEKAFCKDDEAGCWNLVTGIADPPYTNGLKEYTIPLGQGILYDGYRIQFRAIDIGTNEKYESNTITYYE